MRNVATASTRWTACHTVPRIRSPRGIVSRPLGDVVQGPFAGQLPNTPNVLAAFLREPSSLVPRTGMPNVGPNVGGARHIAAYLYALNEEKER